MTEGSKDKANGKVDIGMEEGSNTRKEVGEAELGWLYCGRR